MSDDDDADYAAAAAADYYADYDNYRDAGSDEEDALPDDLDYYLENEPAFQQSALERDPAGLEIDQGTYTNIYRPISTEASARELLSGEINELPPDDVIIPDMPAKERQKVHNILEAKREHLNQVDAEAANEPRRIIVNQYSLPINEESEYTILDQAEAEHCKSHHTQDDAERIGNEEEDEEFVPMLISDPDALRRCTDESLYRVIPEYYPEIKKVTTSAKAFNDAIVQIEVSFNAREIQDANLYTKAKRVGEVLSSLVYRFIDIFYAMNPQHSEDREFKVQVGFSVVMKKLKKGWPREVLERSIRPCNILQRSHDHR